MILFLSIMNVSLFLVRLVGIWSHYSSDLCRYVLIDTPGQIEVFTWSASGTIITEALVALYIINISQTVYTNG